jgi:hypothetical protein
MNALSYRTNLLYLFRLEQGGESHYDIKGSRSDVGVEFQDDNDYGFVKLTINSNTP